MDTQDVMPPRAASLGQDLAAERERQGLTRSEISQRLHLSVSQIEALEADRYDQLPRGPFLRGFVRNYSKVLGLEPEAMAARLASAAPRESAPRIVVPSQNIRFGEERLSNSPYVKAAVVAAVGFALSFAGMYWWLFIRPTPPAQEGARKVEPGPPQQLAAPPVPAPETPPPAPAPQVAEAPAQPEPAKVEPPAPEPQPPRVEPAKAAPAKPAERAPSAGSARLQFRFRADAWVEIRDAQGRVVHSRVNARGSEAEVAGQPPLTVVVGNAQDVSLRVNDRDFPLEPHTKVSVARFTVE